MTDRLSIRESSGVSKARAELFPSLRHQQKFLNQRKDPPAKMQSFPLFNAKAAFPFSFHAMPNGMVSIFENTKQ